jgi:hypothetical protein
MAQKGVCLFFHVLLENPYRHGHWPKRSQNEAERSCECLGEDIPVYLVFIGISMCPLQSTVTPVPTLMVAFPLASISETDEIDRKAFEERQRDVGIANTICRATYTILENKRAVGETRTSTRLRIIGMKALPQPVP